MDTIGLDLHKRESQLCILAEDAIVVERRVVTTRERFTAVPRPACLTTEREQQAEQQLEGRTDN